ncbi:MAG: carbon storage regulator CsrA [Desulfobulbaceae bacterium]|uniref:Translational regulator CsrA n=1 Tax=Candidatus Desulfobia pelagia TaxID=2841692 RepID=A0A8J6TCA6_9BACT|nr:carbon storage regulator CsrA [Candidatus Desulfobia pelagia]
MLILARKEGEAIIVADNVRIQILETKAGQVKLGIEAPGHITIHREEIYQRIVEENKKAAMETPLDLTSLDDVFPLKK